MVDISKLSEMINEQQEKTSSGLNPIEAIKMLTDLIKTAKELQGQQQQPPAIKTIDDIKTPAVKQEPKPAAKPEPKREVKPELKSLTHEQKSKAFDEIIRGLELGLKFFGENISAKEYIEQLKKYKNQILEQIKL